jgi:hypothetical protein
MPAMGMAAMRNVTTLGEKGGGIYEGPGEVQTGGTWPRAARRWMRRERAPPWLRKPGIPI